MNNAERLSAELAREWQSIDEGFERLLKEEQQRSDFGDGSNTAFARSIKKQIITDSIRHLTYQIELAKDPANRMKDTLRETSNATAAIKHCLGIELVCKKITDGEYETNVAELKRNYFDLDRSVFLAVQIMIDSSLSPIIKTTRLSPNTDEMKSTSAQKSLTQLREIIGKKVEQETRHMAIKANMPGFFESINRYASGEYSENQMRSSTFYWERSMKEQIRAKAASIASNTEMPELKKRAELDLLTWKPWNRTQRVHVGAWLLNGIIRVCQQLNVFTTGKLLEHNKSGEYVTLTKKGDEVREEFLKDSEQFCWREQPMLCEPIDNTTRKCKGFLLPSMWERPPGYAGVLKMSEQHLTFINKLQKVPYQINPFIAELMDVLVKHDMKLGKFIPEFYKSPPSVAHMLGFGSIVDKDEQDRLVYNHPDFKKTKRLRSAEKERRRKMVQDGSASRELYSLVQKNRKHDKFWIPIFWDFRGRVYYRVSYLNPQSTDPGKSVLQFANPTKTDGRTKFYLQLALSAAAGKDKLSYEDRCSWVLQNEREIKNVAKMLDTGDFQSAIAFLESVDDPFDFAAASREYYNCCLLPIDKRQKFTNYRCHLDATAQGSQIISGLRKSHHGASKVNVLKTDKPNDVYLNLWDELIDQAVHYGGSKENKPWKFPVNLRHKLKKMGYKDDPRDGLISFRPALLKWLKTSGKGRKIAKSGILMTAQYGSGIDRQLEDILDIISDFPKNRQFNIDELSCIYHVLKSSTDKVASISAFVKWMRDRVESSLDNGSKTFYLPTPNGNVCMMRYAQRKKVLIKTFHHGSVKLDPLNNRFSHLESLPSPEKSDWMKACAANQIHCLDATLLSQGFHDWQFNLSTVHDSIASSPGVAMDVVVRRFKEAFINTVKWDFWKAVYEANRLPTEIDGEEDQDLRSIIIGDLNLDDIQDANYLIC